MSIFGLQSPQPTKINRVQINQSVLGFAIPVVMGKGRVQQTILWADGLTSKKVSPNGGKGIGGGKGTEYEYSSDVLAALCNGGGYVTGIGDVWSGQSWLSATITEDPYTITGPSPSYIPVNAGTMGADHGVSENTTYGVTFNDVGSSGPTNLTGSSSIAFERVPYGTVLAPGQYSVDGANTYYFSPSDVGRTVTVSYSFTLKTIKAQEIALIPSGRTLTAGSVSQPHIAFGSVVYATGPNEGTAFKRVSSPSNAGEYSVSGSKPATYTFASADINQEIRLTYYLDNRQALGSGQQKSLNFTLYEGEKGQEPWPLLLSNFPDAALGYSGIALAAYAPMDLGYGAQIQQNTFEVLTSDAWGGGIVDCSPVQCIFRVLTDEVWGLGSGPVPFPVSAIDVGSGGTWGATGATGALRQDSTAVSWFAANNFFISPVIDRQDTAASLISRWLDAGQCTAFMSEGLLKLVPLGDTSVAGNGAIWVAPQAFDADLDDSCFLQKNTGDDPVQIASAPWPDAFNHVQVSWNNRAQQYAPELTYESDQAAINRYGSRIEDPQAWDFITTLPSATFAANMRVKRNVYIRNTYQFSLSHRYDFLEPMDIVRITTSSSWSLDNRLEIESLPVRIRKVVDNPDGSIDFEAEDYHYGTSQATIFNKASSSGSLVSDNLADPGNTEAVIFEAPSRLTGFQGNQLWIGACSGSPDWGSCEIWASMDGDTYKSIGTIEAQARLGVLGAALPSGGDPDTANNLTVILTEGSVGLDSGTTSDADIDNTLCYVGGELISYSTLAISGRDQYTASGYLRRGRKGSTVAAHAAGALFLRLDNTIFKYTYDPTWAGKTVYLKFQSRNVYGNAPQDLSILTPVSFTIPGVNGGTVDASTGLVVTQFLPPNAVSNTACDAQLSSTAALTATINVYGPGGPGTSWTFTAGSIAKTYPASTMVGFAHNTTYYVVYDTAANSTMALSSYPDVLLDNYLVIGAITTPASGGASAGGAPGGGYSCTLEGTPLDTPDGPVDNRELLLRFELGQSVYISGRYGPEIIIAAKWVESNDIYEVKAEGHKPFMCSDTHLVRVAGHYKFVRDCRGFRPIETRAGYATAAITKTAVIGRVLELQLSGPSCEYSIDGIFTHNLKIGPPST